CGQRSTTADVARGGGGSYTRAGRPRAAESEKTRVTMAKRKPKSYDAMADVVPERPSVETAHRVQAGAPSQEACQPRLANAARGKQSTRAESAETIQI